MRVASVTRDLMGKHPTVEPVQFYGAWVFLALASQEEADLSRRFGELGLASIREDTLTVAASGMASQVLVNNEPWHAFVMRAFYPRLRSGGA